MKKSVLLIAGGGTLGQYVSQELLNLNCRVDVICLEDKTSTEDLTFYREYATLEFLAEFLKDRYYDAIVNFLHYTNAEDYQPFYELLIQKTAQLVLLSSYRVYADEQHPLTEDAPLLADVCRDEVFLANETYAMGKTKCERFIRSRPEKNWTIVRPVISFAGTRFDVVMHTNQTVVDAAREGRVLPLPEGARKLCAGLDWAGNSGKLIAHLLFKKDALGGTFTISSGQNVTWEEIASWYTELLGTRFEWIPTEEYMKINDDRYRLIYDRLFDRDVDVSRVMAVTGLKPGDFTPLKEAIRVEVDKIK